MEERLRTLEVAVAGIGSRLDAVLPTLVTRADLLQATADLHEALHAQTWKIVGAVLGAAGLLLAGTKLLH